MVGVKLAGMKDVIEMVGAVLDGIIVVYEQSEKRLGKASSEFDAWKEKNMDMLMWYQKVKTELERNVVVNVSANADSGGDVPRKTPSKR